ncbi:MAG TPA: proton-conducting transporter membrane subunit [Solirubrobacteraceae bacterium]|jgi:multicomponent Na+:H+ antiporter subunit D|nr:proton-conducting transporter membrane subunit [Solirubrobacteraceae bacterium]
MSLLVAPLAVLWPTAVIVAFADGRRRPAGVAAISMLAAAFGLLVALAVRVAADGPVDVLAGGWPADVGIRLRADALGTSMAVVSVFVVLVALIQDVVSGTSARLLPALMLFLALGLTGLFLTGDVFSFYVFFELSLISSYALSAVGGERRMTGGALIFAVVNLLGSFIFLIAVAALYRATGTLEMAAVAERAAEIDPNTAILIAVSFFIAFGVKLGLFPFHFWLPAIYGSAPTAVTAVLAGAVANIGAYGLLRFGAGLLPREVELASGVLIGLGSASIIYGAVQAIGRRDSREVLAYSAIGHAGYVIVALGLGGPVALAAAVLFTLVNALQKGLLFLAVDLRGPLVSAAFVIGAFSVAGVPPTAGFFGKAALFEAGVDAGSVAAVALLFVGGALTFIYLFQAYQHDFWRPEADGARTVAPVGARLVVAFVALVVLAVGLWPEPLVSLAGDAAQDLLQRGGA